MENIIFNKNFLKIRIIIIRFFIKILNIFIILLRQLKIWKFIIINYRIIILWLNKLINSIKIIRYLFRNNEYYFNCYIKVKWLIFKTKFSWMVRVNDEIIKIIIIFSKRLFLICLQFYFSKKIVIIKWIISKLKKTTNIFSFIFIIYNSSRYNNIPFYK
jgi:hypothetical protein